MDTLSKKLAQLPPEALSIIERLVAAISQSNAANLKNKHWLVNERFYALFGMRLGMYHALTRCPVNKKVFESLLSETCNELKILTILPKSHTAVIDLLIQDKKISLKSEGRIHSNVHMSKFSELGWGPWKTPKDLYYKIHRKGSNDTNKTFESRIDLYDHVFTLQHELSDESLKYELIEIPVSTFRRILEIPLTDYVQGMRNSNSTTTEAKSFAIRIPWSKRSGSSDIIVKFDGGSERKLTITLPKESCTILAQWSFKL